MRKHGLIRGDPGGTPRKRLVPVVAFEPFESLELPIFARLVGSVLARGVPVPAAPRH